MTNLVKHPALVQLEQRRHAVLRARIAETLSVTCAFEGATLGEIADAMEAEAAAWRALAEGRVDGP